MNSFCIVGWIASIVLLTFAVAACAFSRQPQKTFYSPAIVQRETCWNHPLHSSFGRSNEDSHTLLNTMAPKQQQQEAVASAVPVWFQHEVKITAPSRGCHLITGDIQKAISGDLSKIKIGMCNLFIQHTSASLTINENADPDVRRDMEVALNKIIPASWNRDGTFLHTMEGDDDMPGHVKSSLMGVSLNVPIQNGRLALGTWQGIYLNEHRDQGGWGGGHTRRIVITLQGQQAA